MGVNVVVVESPAKAKTLEKYLGPGFKVLASYGHVRDLPARDGSVRPDEDFAMTYEAAPFAPADDAALDGAREAVLESLGPRPVGVDEIIRQCQVTPPVALTVLLELELAGRLDRHPGNKFSLK